MTQAKTSRNGNSPDHPHACKAALSGRIQIAGQRVRIFDYPDGRLAIRHQGLDLPYTIFDQVRQVEQGAVMAHKRLDAVLACIRDQQLRHPERRRRSGPRRHGQTNSLFGPNSACA
jgi:hypothetical protein